MQPIVMMLVMFGIFYFVLIRPQAKKQKEHREMLARLGEDDIVITRGGLIGRIVRASEDILVIELQDGVRGRVPRAYVEGKWNAAKLAS